MASLQHENILHVHDFVNDGHTMCIVMEYVQGIDLYDLLERTPVLPVEVAAIVALQVARALDYAHFVCLGYRQDEIDPLAAHAAHVHLRQARPGALQAKAGEGVINMEAQFGALRDAGYAGHMALEYVHQDYMGTLYDDVLTETLRLRDRWRRWAGETP